MERRLPKKECLFNRCFVVALLLMTALVSVQANATTLVPIKKGKYLIFVPVNLAPESSDDTYVLVSRPDVLYVLCLTFACNAAVF